jgi:phytanoyl-CoA hydroxylase
MDTLDRARPGTFDDAATAYRRGGWVLLPGLLAPDLIAAALEALSAIADESAPLTASKALLERTVDPATLTATNRIDHVRKFVDFTDDFPALRRIAMDRCLHATLDRLLGEGRVLFQEMALVKPPRIGTAKRWHQDAAYFRVSDPGLIVGVWIALDPATRANGCMELIPGSHLAGPVPHVPMGDVNECHIRPDLVAADHRVAIEMAPGDALVFHPCLHHMTEPNHSDMRRRALQFHYHQTGMEWRDLEWHRRWFQDATGAYCGCTVPAEPVPPGAAYTYRPGLARPVTPMG